MVDPDLWKHQPEHESINPKRGNINPNARTSTRSDPGRRQMRVLIEKSPAVTWHFLSTTKFKKQQTM
ncbi:hypothetical protein [Lentibacillus sp. Marseille-P4043]|uniref:hypothetical protein n=1 Tax=Lentibacillus sp. Marseille-P4043 TaxID=2040293 RepID=UPI00131A5A2E|nr:hypothetical protein [Lentibacillus sp. Marseille-P4043]